MLGQNLVDPGMSPSSYNRHSPHIQHALGSDSGERAVPADQVGRAGASASLEDLDRVARDNEEREASAAARDATQHASSSAAVKEDSGGAAQDEDMAQPGVVSRLLQNFNSAGISLFLSLLKVSPSVRSLSIEL